MIKAPASAGAFFSEKVIVNSEEVWMQCSRIALIFYIAEDRWSTLRGMLAVWCRGRCPHRPVVAGRCALNGAWFVVVTLGRIRGSSPT